VLRDFLKDELDVLVHVARYESHIRFRRDPPDSRLERRKSILV